MTDSETPPEASIEDRFRIVHDHLDLVDRTLAELETELEIVPEDTTFDVTYDLDTGSFHADLSIEHVVSRLNECLEPPLFALALGTICDHHYTDTSVAIPSYPQLSVEVRAGRNSVIILS